MSALRSFVVASAILGGFVASAEAQGVVPGGWAPQVGYQQFGGAGGYTGGFAVGGPSYGGGFYGGFGPLVGGGGFAPYGGTQLPYGAAPLMTLTPSSAPLYGSAWAIPPQTTVATDPLIGAIRQTTRRSNRR